MSDCEHPAYALTDGALLCASCGAPSPSPEWLQNVYGGEKAVAQATTENKGRFWPSESKRRGGRRGMKA